MSWGAGGARVSWEPGRQRRLAAGSGCGQAGPPLAPPHARCPRLPRTPRSGATNTFHLEHAPGNLIAAREVFQAAHYPLPACLGASQPVLRLGFRGAAASDAWIQDQGALRLELHYIPPGKAGGEGMERGGVVKVEVCG